MIGTDPWTPKWQIMVDYLNGDYGGWR